MRVVFCWEMGGNYGHIAGFLPLYTELVRQGIEVWCILRERRFAYLLGEEILARCVQAPSPKCIAQQKPLYSYADILSYIGYLQEPVVTRYIADWCSLLQQIQPQVVIADHSPTALLAARHLAIPAFSIGTGFTNPPADENFPWFFPERPAPHGHIDAQLLYVVNRALKNLQGEPLAKLGDIFNGSQVVLNTFAELDHYGARENTQYWGPLYSQDIGEAVKWPEHIQPRIFAYLTPQIPNFSLALKEVMQLPGYKILHIPGVDATSLVEATTKEVCIKTTAVRLESILDHADLVINQGGMGLSSQCFIRGIPQVIIPTQIEQRMLARRMLMQKLALAVDPKLENPPYEETFQKALDVSFKQKIMPTYKDFSLQQQVEKIVKEIISVPM